MVEIMGAASPFFEQWFAYTTAAVVLLLSFIGMTPLSLMSVKEARTIDYVWVFLRRVGWTYLTLVGIAGWFTYYFAGGNLVYERGGQAARLQFESIVESIGITALASCVIAFVFAQIIMFLVERHLGTWLSSLRRRYRYNVSGDKESDIRDLMGKMEAKDFLPEKYYKIGEKIFVGLNGKDEPVYIDHDQFHETHTEIIGPTRSGKGVVMGCIAQQSVLNGNTFILHDPKHDRFLPHIMIEVCKRTGANFVFFDLNDEYMGSWNPFSGGTKREQRTRLMWALGMGETGSDADFYKLGEKKTIDALLKNQKWSVPGLIKELSKGPEDNQAKRAISALSEIGQISTFTPNSKKGIKWEKVLSSDKPNVIYIRGNLNDDTIKKMHRLLLIELNQYIIRLEKEGKRKHHVTQMVDEVNFLTSMPLADALSTIGGFRCNMVLAYQSPAQLRNVPDQQTDPDVIEESTHTNCQNKLIYRMGDPELAEWAAGQTGTQWKTVKRMEKTQTNGIGSETWSEEASYNKVEEKYISENVFQSLDQRIGVLISPGVLSSVIYTCFVPTKQETDFFGPEYKTLEEDADQGAKPNKQTKQSESNTAAGESPKKDAQGSTPNSKQNARPKPEKQPTNDPGEPEAPDFGLDQDFSGDFGDYEADIEESSTDEPDFDGEEFEFPVDSHH